MNIKTFSSANDYNSITRAVSQIRADYGHEVSIIEKNKTLLKFGRIDSLGTSFETIWVQGGNETYATGNDIDSISSSNSGDTQTVTIEGHTISGSDLTFVVQSVTLTGQTTATLSTPLYRATRMYNTGSSDFAGDIYVYESGGTVTNGVPQTSADIHLKCLIGSNQSLKCATATSSVDYWIIDLITVSVNRQQTRSVDFRVQVREFGKVFRTILPPIGCNSESGTIIIPLKEPLIIKPNSDVRVIAASSNTGTGASASLHGRLAIIT